MEGISVEVIKIAALVIGSIIGGLITITVYSLKLCFQTSIKAMTDSLESVDKNVASMNRTMAEHKDDLKDISKIIGEHDKRITILEYGGKRVKV